MEVLDRAALGLGEAAEMHEAGHVDADEQIWLDVENSIEFEVPHPPRNVWEGDGKSAAKTAALLGLTEGDDLRVIDGCQQRADGLAGASAAGVAGTVEGETGGFIEFSRPGFYAQAVVNEVHDFPSALSQ